MSSIPDLSHSLLLHFYRVSVLSQEHRIQEDQGARELSETPSEHRVVCSISDCVKWVRGADNPK